MIEHALSIEHTSVFSREVVFRFVSQASVVEEEVAVMVVVNFVGKRHEA